MNIIVAGGAGFVGSHLCDKLLGLGHRVWAVDNLVTGRLENIRHNLKNSNFKFIKHDIAKPLRITFPTQRIYNLASPASPIDYQLLPIETLTAGSYGSHNLLNLARTKKARYLLASTSEVYGDPLVHPQPESYWGNVNSIGPRSCYDESKRYAEAVTMAYKRIHKLDVRIVRIFNTYGPRMRLNDGRVVPALVDQALHNRPVTVFGDGSQTRSFCYVSDLVEGIVCLMESREPLPVNIGNPHEMSILNFAKAILKFTDTRSKICFKPLPTDDPKQRRPDICKAKSILKWQPKISFETGIKQTIDWFSSRKDAK
jgi:dTDP-glucose 4,6-dehydratase